MEDSEIAILAAKHTDTVETTFCACNSYASQRNNFFGGGHYRTAKCVGKNSYVRSKPRSKLSADGEKKCPICCKCPFCLQRILRYKELLLPEGSHASTSKTVSQASVLPNLGSGVSGSSQIEMSDNTFQVN